MLPEGPRYSFPLPPTPQSSSRDLARQILSSIRSEIRSANAIRVGIVSTGCDGLSTINPLDGACDTGTAQGSACDLVLYHPATRSVVSREVGRTLSGNGLVCLPGKSTVFVLPIGGSTGPVDCPTQLVDLRARRRFIDNLGNIYGPDGAWLSGIGTPAVLNSEYVHRFVTSYCISHDGILRDPPVYTPGSRTATLEKVTASPASVTLSYVNGIVAAFPAPWTDDAGLRSLIYTQSGDSNPVSSPAVLEDVSFSGSYTGTLDAWFYVAINSAGTPDTFNWAEVTFPSGGFSGSAIPITGSAQALSHGISVTFGATTGHSVNRVVSGHSNLCTWVAALRSNDEIVRYGVGARGAVPETTDCVTDNTGIMVTTADDVYTYGNHAILVRDADTLAVLYRKALTYDGTPYSFGTPGEKFSFSATEDGFFFAHCYLTPVLSSPPTPYPGAEWGAPNPRKVAVISVNPSTFEPTITELITLEDNGSTAGSTFVVAETIP